MRIPLMCVCVCSCSVLCDVRVLRVGCFTILAGGVTAVMPFLCQCFASYLYTRETLILVMVTDSGVTECAIDPVS
jgi:hypothetical protein